MTSNKGGRDSSIKGWSVTADQIVADSGLTDKALEIEALRWVSNVRHESHRKDVMYVSEPS